jgi:hypothetical protein
MAYSFSTGQGLNPYLLKSLKQVFGEGNDSSIKIDNLGFLNMLNSGRKISLNRQSAPGAVEFVQIKYRQRAVVGQTSTTDNCATGNFDPFMEIAVPLNIYRNIGLFLDDALLQEYADDCVRTQALGMPPTMAMVEMINLIMSAANAILEGLDIDLQNQMVFGTNIRTGSNAASTINITQVTTTLPLQDGLTQILTDAQRNVFATGKPLIYGSGLFHNFMNQQNAKGLAENGLNTSIEAMGVRFFFDQYAQTTLGTNEIAVISPDAVQLVEFDKFTGPFGGHKGIADLGTFMLPIQVTPTHVIPMSFDYQLRYLDCAESTATVADYYGNPLVSARGYQMIISKTCGLLQTPQNAYKASDSLIGTNGVLRYSITNI